MNILDFSRGLHHYIGDRPASSSQSFTPCRVAARSNLAGHGTMFLYLWLLELQNLWCILRTYNVLNTRGLSLKFICGPPATERVSNSELHYSRSRQPGKVLEVSKFLAHAILYIQPRPRCCAQRRPSIPRIQNSDYPLHVSLQQQQQQPPSETPERICSLVALH